MTTAIGGPAVTGRSTDAVSLRAALHRVENGTGATWRGWNTGLSPLDVHLGGGFHAGDLVLLAGAHGVGKTAMALQIARNVAAAGGRVAHISYEHRPSTLAERLLVLESSLVAGDRAPGMVELRAALTQMEPGERLERTGARLERCLGSLPGVAEALASIASYDERLTLVGARGDETDLARIRELALSGDPGLIVVDYLQKVPVPGVRGEESRIARIAVALKDLALEASCPVLAITAVDRDGLRGGRIRSRNLKGSVTLAYEADVVLVLQDKYDVVARQHLVYDSSAATAHHRWLVCSVEKNRHGEGRLDLEFRKRLSHGLLDPVGRMVEDRLIDERIDGP